MGVQTDKMILKLMEVFKNALAADDPIPFLMLFQNDISITTSTVYTDLVQASFGGYSDQELLGGEWSGPTLAAHVATLLYNNYVEFTQSSGSDQVIYGWAVYEAATEELWGGDRFATPITSTTGATIKVKPSITQRNYVPPGP